jgi:two-component system KDP operon response regulator KdpE
MSNKLKLLVVEDDPGICKYLKTTLGANGYDVVLAEMGTDALHLASSHCPDCILLDLGLPDLDGNEIIRELRGWTSVPIVVISARSADTDKVLALDLGADDYLTKPFSTAELLARIRAAYRHTRTAAANGGLALADCYRVGDLLVDYKKRRVFLCGGDANLTPNEFRIVALLGRYAGQVLTYKHILTELWGPSASSDNKILRVHMASIRRKIELDPHEPVYIMTEVGVGYRMAEEAQSPPP